MIKIVSVCFRGSPKIYEFKIDVGIHGPFEMMAEYLITCGDKEYPTPVRFLQYSDTSLFPEDQVKTITSYKLVSHNKNWGVDNLISRVIYSSSATIVLWKDGTKTIVRAKDEPFDKEKGLAMAIVKRWVGSIFGYGQIFDKWCSQEKREKEKVDDDSAGNDIERNDYFTFS